MIEYFRLHEKPERRLHDAHHGGLRDSRTLEHYDVTYYELELDMPTGSGDMSGVVRMHLRSLEDDLSQLELHAGDNLTLGQVTVDGQAATHTHDGDHYVVTLPQALDAGQAAVLETHYTAVHGGGGVLAATRTNVQTGQLVETLTTQAEPWDARRFWPCRDEPIDKADSLLARITTQDYNTVVSNGVMRSNTTHPDGTRTVTWFEERPMVTYLFSVCIAPYNHRNDTWEYGGYEMPMDDWSWGLSPSEQQFVSQTGLDALDVFSDLFGIYPYVEQKYGHAQYTWGGAMEHQSVSSMGFYNQAVIAHELMHQWFGDKVTCESFHHIWLNEGWATYGEALFFESIGGSQTLHDYMDFEEYYGPGTVYVESPETESIFDGNLSYAKGAWVLHMLRHVMGDNAFFAGARNYLGGTEDTHYRTVDTEEFQGFMEAAYGDTLGYFFSQWLHGEYYPDYLYDASITPFGDDTLLQLGVVQTQVPERQMFTMPLDLVVYYTDRQDTTFRFHNNEAIERWGFLLPAPPDSVRLDPDNWVLGRMRSSDLALPDVRLLDTVIRANGQPVDALPDAAPFELLLELGNFGSSVVGAQATLTCLDERIQVNTPTQDLSDLDLGQTSLLLFGCTSLETLSGRPAFELEITWGTNTETLEFRLDAGNPSLLVVDDDPDHAWEQLFVEALPEERVQVISPADFVAGPLDSATLVLWHQGNTGRAFTPGERAAIGSRMVTGGSLVLSGQDLLQAQDTEWAEQTLGLAVIETGVSSIAVRGELQAFFAEDLLMFVSGGAGNQSHMDRLDPMNSYPVFHYQNSVDPGDAGVVYETDAGGGKVLSLGFGLEGVSGAGVSMSLGEVLQRLLAWSRGEVDLDGPPSGLPETPRITGTWPNPFNPATRIGFDMPAAGNAELLVYNLAGQHVATLHRGRLAAGRHEVTWQPDGRASAVYIVRLHTDAGKDTRKVLYLK
jgi:aminopeptidase N